MLNGREKQVIKTLIDSLVENIDSKKIIKSGFNVNSIIFDILHLTNNRKSKLLRQSSEIFLSENVSKLLDDGYVKRMDVGGNVKYAITFKGISTGLELFYDMPLNEQYQELIRLLDQKVYADVESGDLNWKEKIAVTALFTLGCITEKSAMNLQLEKNRDLFEDYLNQMAEILYKFAILDKKYDLPTTTGEPKASYLMRAQTTKLGRKTDHIYKFIPGGKGYYLDLLQDGMIKTSQSNYLLNKIVPKFDSTVDYQEFKNELLRSARNYQSKFISIEISSLTTIEVMNALNEYFDREIWNHM